MDVEDEGGGGAKNKNSMLVTKSEDMCTNDDHLMLAPEPVKEDGGDTTECSSSFGDTCSGFEDEADDGELEVNSGRSTHANFGGPSKLPRRKKVATEWRNCVRPILWRCQWLEVHMKELSTQVSMYDRELSLIKKQKDLQQAVSKANGAMSEPMRIDKGHRNSIMKRRKRKRHEENVYASFYIKKHQILSYYHGKQKKGTDTDGLLIGDDCGNTALLDSEDYDMIFGQHTLKDIFLTIDGIQSRVHLLQGCLNKAHSKGEILAFSEENTHVREARKRQHTQKRSLSYTKCQYTNSIPNVNIVDSCKTNTDDILIDNQAANETCQQIGKAKHLPSGHCSKGQNISTDTKNISAPTEVKNTCSSVKIESPSAPKEEQESFLEKSATKKPISPGNEQELKPKKRKRVTYFTKQRKEASKTPSAKEKTEDMLSASKNQTGSRPSAVAKGKTVSRPSAATGPDATPACLAV